MALDNDSIKWLSSHFGSNVKFDEPMSRHTSLRVGGPAEAFVVPENIKDLKGLIKWSWEKKLPYLIVGDGTNLLVKDAGINGIVVVLTKCLNTIAQTGTGTDGIFVTAMAGARLRKLCSFAMERGLKGINFAVGIPGTIGGGIMMNAGTARGAMENALESINVLLPTGRLQRIKREKLNFSYRNLTLNNEVFDGYQGHPIILDGCFCLRPSDPGKLKKEAQAILKTRKERQPTGFPSAGCFYKNPAYDKTAGEIIELAGLKGKSIGGAEISSKHANFIVNRQRASAADFLALMKLVEETVSKMFDIDLEREVKVVGP